MSYICAFHVVGKRNVILIESTRNGHRRIISQQFTGTISSSIGLLTALTRLYVCRLCFDCCLTFGQIRGCQSIEWNADFIHWPIDGARLFVRCQFE
jgi:hypothetical protein